VQPGAQARVVGAVELLRRRTQYNGPISLPPRRDEQKCIQYVVEETQPAVITERKECLLKVVAFGSDINKLVDILAGVTGRGGRGERKPSLTSLREMRWSSRFEDTRIQIDVYLAQLCKEMFGDRYAHFGSVNRIAAELKLAKIELTHSNVRPPGGDEWKSKWKLTGVKADLVVRLKVVRIAVATHRRHLGSGVSRTGRVRRAATKYG